MTQQNETKDELIEFLDGILKKHGIDLDGIN